MLSEAGGFPADAFERLAEIEPGQYWFESRNRLIVWALRTYFADARSLLEVGCGTGFVLQGVRGAFPHMALTASDALDGGLAIARERVPDATLFRQDARALDLREQFDVACAFDVLEHIVEDEEALRRLHAAVVPGGGVLITVPQHPWLWSRADDFGHHVRRYTRRELVSRLESSGFEVLRVTSFVTLLLPLMAASRWYERRHTGPLTGREAKPPATVNRVLNMILTAERRLITAGLSLPAGGSLLAVARKRPS
jgi:SAM-dependent methyltransferase